MGSGDNATDEIPSATERVHKVTKKEMKKQIALLEQSRAEWIERHRVNCAGYRAEVARLMDIIDEYERMHSIWNDREANK